MSACMNRNSELLKVLAKCKPELRKHDTIKLKPKTAKKLAPHSKHIKFAADKRNPIVKRRTRLVQKGAGFLPFLLTSVLEQLANFL